MSKVPQPIAERAADLLAGLSYPQRLPDLVGAFREPAASFPRITIADALAVEPWPGRSNDYLANGWLRDPSRAAQGQNFYVGVALGHDLVRAFLLGLLCDLPSSEEKRRRMYQTACGLADGDLQKLQQQVSSLQSQITSITSTTITTITSNLPRAIIDTNGAPGDVVRWNGANHLEVATGEFIDDQETVVGILGAAATAGQETEYYPSGTKTPPIAGLTLGRVYRHRDGSAKNGAALIAGDYSLQLGVANGDGRIDVTIDAQDFKVPEPVDP